METKKRFGKSFAIIIAIALSYSFYTYAVDNPHYYKAPYFNATKSFQEKSWLSSIDVHYAHGDTCNGYDCRGKEVGAFNIYGCHNILYLTSNVPDCASLSTMLQGYVDTLNTQRTNFEQATPPERETFGMVEFSGRCQVDELVINWRQNLVANLFVEGNVPIRKVKAGPMKLIDRSPASETPNAPYTQTDTAWVNFRDNLEAIMNGYGITGYQCGSDTTNLGDITLLVGYQKTFKALADMFRYITVVVKGGLLFPTGSTRNFGEPFSLETGYNKHLGIPLRADVTLGLSDDIYWGIYGGAIFFSSSTHNTYPIKTDARQNGFIKLFRAQVNESKGTLVDLGTYLKLDHFFKGLSFLVGYSFNHRANDSLCLSQECSQTNNTIINSDARIKSWQMHVLHLFAQYDFGTHNNFKKRFWQPRVGVFYDYPFDGKKVMTTDMFGGTVGCDISWGF